MRAAEGMMRTKTQGRFQGMVWRLTMLKNPRLLEKSCLMIA